MENLAFDPHRLLRRRGHRRTGPRLAVIAGMFVAAVTAMPAAPITVRGIPHELRIREVTAHCVEILLAPAAADGRAIPLPASPMLVDYRAQEKWRGRSVDGETLISCGALTLRLTSAPLSLAVVSSGGALVQRLTWADDGAMTFRTPAPVFGLGQGGGGLDRRGRVQPLTDGYVAGNDTNRNVSPILIGTDGWALFLPDLPELTEGRTDRRAGLRGEFNLRSDPGVFRPADATEPGRVFLICAPEPVQIVEELTQLTGRAPMPPRWALGYFQSHRTLGGWDEVLGVAQAFREKRLPCDGLIYLSEVFCKSGWGNGVAPFAWNPRNFPEPASNLRTLHDLGYKVIVHAARQPAGLQGDNVAAATDDASHIASYWRAHRDVHQAGIDGWWPDEGEVLTTAGRLARHRLYQAGPLQLRPDERPWALHRTGAPGAQRYGGWIWSGDPFCTWQAFAAHVPAALNHGLSLTPFWGSDAGGFIPKPELTGELYVRWFQFAAFSSCFRSHGRTWHLRLPWGWNTGSPGIVESTVVPPAAALRNATVEPICRQYLELRYQLLAYNYALARAACETGLPMMRALWLHHPDDPAAVARHDEFLWGQDLLVAPVLEQGATDRTVYLPRGTWYDWWTGVAHQGGREINRPVDLATLPLYARAGAIIPLDPVRQHTGETTDGPLTLLVYAGADGGTMLYEDDGRSLGYQRGEFSRRRSTWNDATATLRVEADPGRYASALPSRNLRVRVRWPDGRTAEKSLARQSPTAAVDLSFR